MVMKTDEITCQEDTIEKHLEEPAEEQLPTLGPVNNKLLNRWVKM